MTNYYYSLAKLLGIKLNEPFKSKDKASNKELSTEFTLTKWGLCPANKSHLLHDILSGHLAISVSEFIPKKGESYFYIDFLLGKMIGISEVEFQYDFIDIANLKLGNCFRTEEDAVAHYTEVEGLFNDILEEIKPNCPKVGSTYYTTNFTKETEYVEFQ